MQPEPGRRVAEERFRAVFSHYGAVVGYARRRGSRYADAIAAEVMTVAWRRLADVPRDDPRPWLYVTARNLLLAEARRAARSASAAGLHDEVAAAPEPAAPDPAVKRALASLSRLDQEALLLTAWEDLTPAQAAKVLGINPSVFRVRLLRARRRFRASLEQSAVEERRLGQLARLDVEGT